MTIDQSASLWEEAQKKYTEASGKSFSDLPRLESTEALIAEVERHNGNHEDFRKKQAAVLPIELVGKMAAGAASIAFPPSSMCFSAVMYLINAAHGVSASLDAITELLGQLQEFTVRLKIYQREDLSQELREKLTEILVTVIEILGQSTKIIKEGKWHRLKSFGKNLLIGKDKTMQDLVSRLAKLTRSEDLLIGAETLVETKRAGRAVDSIQASVENLTISTDQILTFVEQSNTQAGIDKDVAHQEIVKNVLNPSVLAQDRYDEIKRERTPSSGEWILSEAALQEWISSKTPILWVSGNPGCGKSFLTYNIISHLHEIDQEGSHHTSVGYFFFRDTKDQTRSFTQALRDIAYQISQTDPAFAKHVSKAVYKNPNLTSMRSLWQKLFVDFFIRRASKGNPTFIVLDGIDEASSDDRATFFELLTDLQDADSTSTLHVGMLGRPEIIDEMSIELGDGVRTIQVEPVKNGDDIAVYVELSINKSPKLRRLPASLKQEIIKTLSSKAGGMFMWVKLMIAELGQKSRPAAVKEALNAAPRGLIQMLDHVLERFSSSLSEEDADDLNDMLAWVALAEYPLSLGELDAVLRLKSPSGEGVIYLEGNIRKRFASFFSLSRDDNLTTADLQARKTSLVGEENTEVDADRDEGLEDVENDTDFDSNPNTTTVSFSHASISDFFRDPKHGKVKVDGDHPYVGVSLRESRIKIAQTCLNLIVDDSLLLRMKDATSIRTYAENAWIEHLEDVDLSDVSHDDRVSMGTSIARILYEKPLLDKWMLSRNYKFYILDRASVLLKWITDDAVLDNLTEDTRSWIKSVLESPIEIFEPAVKYTAEKYFHSKNYHYPSFIIYIIHSYIIRKAGGVIDALPKFSASEIKRAAEWAGLEQTAEWHRCLGMSLRDLGSYDAALESFDKAVSIDPTMWRAKAGVGKIYIMQEKYHEALETTEALLKILQADDEMDTKEKDFGLWTAYSGKAQCYLNLSTGGALDSDNEAIRLLRLALEHYEKAFSFNDDDFQCIEKTLIYYHAFAIANDVIAKDAADSGKKEDLDIHTKHQCAEQIMRALRLMNETKKGETTNLVKFLHKSKYHDDSVFYAIAWGASEMGELKWLQSKYLEAIAFAEKGQLPVTSANLAVSLGQLYCKYGNDGELAVRLWEAVGSERITSTALASEIGYVRITALNNLGRYYIRKALEDESNADKYITKMERIVAKRRHGSRMGTEDFVPANNVTRYLAAWYHKVGRDEEAREIVKPHIRDALLILSDDDPSNDITGYWRMSKSLLAVGDDVNAIAAFSAIRKYKNGKAVIYENPEDDPGWDNSSTGWFCAGLCKYNRSCCDGMIICRYCCIPFEKDCHALLTDGKLPMNICGGQHSFLTVPSVLTKQVFKEGEVLLDGKAISMEDWKKDLKKEYDLQRLGKMDVTKRAIWAFQT